MWNPVKKVNCRLLVIFSITAVSVIGDDALTGDPQEMENELYNQSSVYLKDMEEIFKNESKVLFKEHIENFRLEMENEIHDIEKFIMNEYDTMINTLNHTGDTARDLVNDSKSTIIDRLISAKEHAMQNYKQIKNKLHTVVEDIESNIENHRFGQRAFDYVKRAFHKIAVLMKLSKKDPILSGEAADADEQEKYQQQILQQMPMVNYFPQLSNVGL